MSSPPPPPAPPPSPNFPPSTLPSFFTPQIWFPPLNQEQMPEGTTEMANFYRRMGIVFNPEIADFFQRMGIVFDYNPLSENLRMDAVVNTEDRAREVLRIAEDMSIEINLSDTATRDLGPYIYRGPRRGVGDQRIAYHRRNEAPHRPNPSIERPIRRRPERSTRAVAGYARARGRRSGRGGRNAGD